MVTITLTLTSVIVMLPRGHGKVLHCMWYEGGGTPAGRGSGLPVGCYCWMSLWPALAGGSFRLGNPEASVLCLQPGGPF